MLVTTGFLAFLGLYSGPTKDDPCGGWVWGGTEVADLAYLFVNWLFSVTVVDWAVALVQTPAPPGMRNITKIVDCPLFLLLALVVIAFCRLFHLDSSFHGRCFQA